MNSRQLETKAKLIKVYQTLTENRCMINDKFYQSLTENRCIINDDENGSYLLYALNKIRGLFLELFTDCEYGQFMFKMPGYDLNQYHLSGLVFNPFENDTFSIVDISSWTPSMCDYFCEVYNKLCGKKYIPNFQSANLKRLYFYRLVIDYYSIFQKCDIFKQLFIYNAELNKRKKGLYTTDLKLNTGGLISYEYIMSLDNDEKDKRLAEVIAILQGKNPLMDNFITSSQTFITDEAKPLISLVKERILPVVLKMDKFLDHQPL